MIGETSSFRSKSLDERNSLGFNSYATLQGLWNIISKNFMNPDADLEDALTFVVRRIEGEAMRSGKPLTEDEGLLLNNLPITPLFPLTPGSDSGISAHACAKRLGIRATDRFSKRGAARRPSSRFHVRS
jgi:hypothetical protein